MIDFQKLKREWKTFTLGVVTSLIGLYDAFIASSLDYTPIIPEHWRPYAPLVIGVLFLLLRQYKDLVSEVKDV
ncbi:hypothetical protein [Bradyrhizobium erythrophlei]|uniref:Uncharacterized protein n=1 Tax=Bradyrhizobium erythrophlei TaxID=1437360 RepID=A0A1M5T878_9BRAD|nr:hypothetical protein [Bradyrhizobium erythrophlei]SHH46810.1 hypothetical protein SAMN05444169_7604 [Bradyrhizobium erythrophlei]